MTTAVLTPYARGHVVELGADGNGRKLYRKQLMKFGPITASGRRYDLDEDYARDIIRSFKQRVISSVPFQLADANNTHTNDPERTRGLVRGLELSPSGDGLDMLVELSAEGAKVVDEFPDLDVSARILDDAAYADGRAGHRVLQHVLGTWNPHLGGMRPWEAIALAAPDSDTTVVDLTTADNEIEKEPAMADTLTAEEIEGIRELLAKKDTDDGKTSDAKAGGAEQADADAEAELKRLGITDDELQKLIADAGQDSGDDADGDADGDGEGSEGDDESDADAAADKEPVGAALASTQQALELANAQGEQNAIELAQVRDELDEQTYARERDQIARDYGIPPRIVDLAKPLLKGSGHVIELAAGDESVDAGAIVRSVLGEVGGLIKVLDLSGEIGHALDLSRSDEAKAEEASRVEWSKKVRSEYGLH